ncbi:hypothetical protein QTN47_27275 [Danxiaibacter flavus]|uniref:Uncharacterized protein n=1 Tax=Danxiaibacter flavus TaxID=3049108 RepID=A0ABV3ZMX8_9BACT|nr:hypothetical protein QNM32_27275 [Chitinophagaceae bacterium DXS]
MIEKMPYNHQIVTLDIQKSKVDHAVLLVSFGNYPIFDEKNEPISEAAFRIRPKHGYNPGVEIFNNAQDINFLREVAKHLEKLLDDGIITY